MLGTNRQAVSNFSGGIWERKENDTLLYYIKGKFSGEDGKDMCYEREENECFGVELRRKIGDLTGA